MRILLLLLILTLNFVPYVLFGQKKEFKYGKVELSELESTKCPIDSSADAYVIGDFGYTFFDYSDSKGFQIVFERHLRIKILKKAALDYGDFSIPIYRQGGNEERLYNLKGNTYNLVNGKIEISKLSKNAVFKEEIDLHHNRMKFTMPNVKEGSIIEIAYNLKSDFNQIPNWDFQLSIPVLYTEYLLRIPEYYRYKVFQNGYLSIPCTKSIEPGFVLLTWNETDENGVNIPNTRHVGKIDYNSNIFKYVGVDLKAFHDEPYMNSKVNYISSIEFELQSTHYPHSFVKEYSSNWNGISKELLDYEYFGGIMKHPNSTNDIVKTAIDGLSDPQQKATAIYVAIRNQFKWNGLNRLLATNGIRKIIEDKLGNSAELNLLLIAALRNAGLKAEPVVLSTCNNGKIVMQYPVLSKLNYVIAELVIGENKYLLDVTDKYAPFGFLPEKCLNGEGVIINEESPESIKLTSNTNYFANISTTFNIDNLGNIKGTWEEINKGYAANYLRHAFGNAKSKEDYVKEYQKVYPGLTIQNYIIENLDSLHLETKIKYDYELTGKAEIIGNLMMIHPLLFEQMENNIFKSEERNFPVDFSYSTNKSFVATLNIPEGYQVETLPKIISIALPGKAAIFLYNISVINNKIQILRKFSLNKVMFLPEEYPVLKEFYNQRLTKESEVIVLKKI